MESCRLSVVSAPDIDEIVLRTNHKFKLDLERKAMEARFRRPVDIFFAKIAKEISNAIVKMKIRGKEAVDDLLRRIDALLAAAESKLKEDFRELLSKLNDYISSAYAEYLRWVLTAIPKKIKINEGEFSLGSMSLGGKASLSLDVKASLCEFLGLLLSGSMSIELRYKWSFLDAAHLRKKKEMGKQE